MRRRSSIMSDDFAFGNEKKELIVEEKKEQGIFDSLFGNFFKNEEKFTTQQITFVKDHWDGFDLSLESTLILPRREKDALVKLRRAIRTYMIIRRMKKRIQETRRKEFQEKAIMVQRMWRGYVGRRKAAALKDSRAREKQEQSEYVKFKLNLRKDGIKMYIYIPKQAKKKKIFLRVDEDNNLTWKVGIKKFTVPLEDIHQIMKGQVSDSFKKHAKKGDPALCFSIVVKKKILDFEVIGDYHYTADIVRHFIALHDELNNDDAFYLDANGNPRRVSRSVFDLFYLETESPLNAAQKARLDEKKLENEIYRKKRDEKRKLEEQSAKRVQIKYEEGIDYYDPLEAEAKIREVKEKEARKKKEHEESIKPEAKTAGLFSFFTRSKSKISVEESVRSESEVEESENEESDSEGSEWSGSEETGDESDEN